MIIALVAVMRAVVTVLMEVMRCEVVFERMLQAVSSSDGAESDVKREALWRRRRQ